MTIAVFTLSLLGAMALGMPIAFALIVCGVALMYQLDILKEFVAQNIINGAADDQRERDRHAGPWRPAATA